MWQETLVFAAVALAAASVVWKYVPARQRLATLDAVLAQHPPAGLAQRLSRWRSRIAASANCPGCDNCGACEPVAGEGAPIEKVITVHRLPNRASGVDRD